MASRRRRLGSRAHVLEFWFRNRPEPCRWGADPADWGRLEAALADADQRFFSFVDPSGVRVAVNLGQLQLVRCRWETGSPGSVTSLPPRDLEGPRGLRLTLEGRGPLQFTPLHPRQLQLAAQLEDLEELEDALRWPGEGELVAVRVDELLCLEYPAEWDAEE